MKLYYVAFMLLAQYDGKAVVPISDVCRDYFTHLGPKKLVDKITRGEIALPLMRIEFWREGGTRGPSDEPCELDRHAARSWRERTQAD